MPAAIPLSTAAVLHGKHDLRLEHRPQLLPPPGHAQVRVMATTLCGSDLHYFSSGANGTFALQHPMCLGHEAAGVITALGPNAPSHFQIGTRVAIECGIPCNNHDTCVRCQEGRYNLCPDMRFCSSAKSAPHLDGTLQTFMNHPYKWLHALPQRITYEQAALAEPLGVVLHASRRASFARGSSVLVFGAGAVGLLACALVRAQGASHVVCVDINQARLEFAVQAGFVDRVLNTASPAFTRATAKPPASGGAGSPRSPTHKLPFQDDMDRAKSTADRILALSGLDATAGGFDVVFECTGAESCIQAGIYAARAGGKVMLIGMGSPNVVLPLSAAACREVDLLGVFRYASTYPSALSLLESGKLDGIEKMITHRFPLVDARRAFNLMKAGTDEHGGLVVKVCVFGEQE